MIWLKSRDSTLFQKLILNLILILERLETCVIEGIQELQKLLDTSK